jgi:hypothetical protein
MPNERKPRSPWLKKLELLKSISFLGVAAELNRRRLDELNRKLANAALSGRERTQYRRLLELVERRGLLTELPSDMRAHADGMKRALIGFHSVIGRKAGPLGLQAPVAHWELAEEMCCDERTARRRAQDVREASLVIVVPRTRAALYGGQAENGIQIVWPTIRDLADSQGIQTLLYFGDEAPQPQQPEPQQELPGVSDAGPGTKRPPGHSGHPPGHSGHPPGHSGHPPGHSGHPPGHSGHVASRRAGAPSPSSFQSENPLPPLPPRRGQHGVTSEEEDFVLTDPDWRPAVAALSTYPPRGIAKKALALALARRHDWTPADVVAFVQQCARTAIDGVQAWGPGPIFWQLCNGTGPNKAAIDIPPDKPYRQARERQQRDQFEEQARQQRQRIDDQFLETEFGPRLDAMSADELANLAERRLSPHPLRHFREHGLVRSVRVPLLKAMQDDLATDTNRSHEANDV